MKNVIKTIKSYLPSVILAILIICTGVTGAVYAKYLTRIEKSASLSVDAYGHMDIALCEGGDKADAWQSESFNIIPGTQIDCDPYVYLGAGNEAGYIYIKVVESIGGGLTFSEYVQYSVNTGAGEWTLLSQNGNEKIYWRFVAVSNSERYFDIISGSQIAFPDTITEAKMTALGGNAVSIRITAYSCHSTNVAGTVNTTPHAQAVWSALQTELNK